MAWIYYIPLVLSLGASDWRVRETAHAKLAKDSDAAIVAILLGEQSDDPEIARRCKQLAAPWFRRHADRLVNAYKPTGWSRWPSIEHVEWVIAMPDGWSDVSVAYTLMAGEKFKHPHNWRVPCEATRLYFRDLIAARVDKGRILSLLAFFCQGDRIFCAWNETKVEPEWPPVKK